MSTLHGIRKFAFAATLASLALLASATQADVVRAGHASGAANAVADLGQMVVVARRDARFADLGSLTVSAVRLPRVSFADLGALTVTAPRIVDTQVAQLGALTVTATRIATVTVAATPATSRSWN
jgi:hypothetical protein